MSGLRPSNRFECKPPWTWNDTARAVPSVTPSSTILRSPLARATLAVVVAQILHDLDHVRQARPASTEVAVAAVLAWVATIVLVVLVVRRHRQAGLYAAVFGATIAIGFVLVHGLPRWSALSDSYGDANADALSWALAAIPFAAGLVLAACGVQAMRGHRTQS